MSGGLRTPLAGFLCLFGFFLHILLSDPLLATLGIHYTGEEGGFYEKVHPGSWFIFFSFAIFMLHDFNPFRQCYLIARDQMAFTALLIVTILMFAYVVLRSGAGGSAFLLDTHLTVPICAIVLCYTPPAYCQRALLLFIAVATINSSIGIAEAMGKFRLFTFDANWVVYKEQFFRASALRGHPLNNAMFTSIALFVLLARKFHPLVTVPLAMLLVVSLVAFGGRAALAYTMMALVLYAAHALWRWVGTHRLSTVQWINLAMLVIVAIGVSFGMIYLLIESEMGERIAAHGFWDKSADSRGLAVLVFDYMKPAEIWFGISADAIIAIVARMNQMVPIVDIENPWLLMFMWLGAIMFPVWLAATVFFVRALLRHQHFATQLAVWAYYAIASTSNSFGRKDSTYLIMVCAVMCLKRWRRETQLEHS